jgi:hypothetical protein
MPLLCAGALLGFGQALENPRVMEKLKLTPFFDGKWTWLAGMRS